MHVMSKLNVKLNVKSLPCIFGGGVVDKEFEHRLGVPGEIAKERPLQKGDVSDIFSGVIQIVSRFFDVGHSLIQFVIHLLSTLGKWERNGHHDELIFIF